MSETRPSSMLPLITVKPTCGRAEVEGGKEADKKMKLKKPRNAGLDVGGEE